MSEQDSSQVAILQHPETNDREAWRAYWETQGKSWRTEPEISTERQNYLMDRRTISPNIEKGIYPFKDIEPNLTRADIEWLLATHEDGRGPVDWNDESQRGRMGLDLRGADLQQVDLHDLPLARTCGGSRWFTTTSEWLRTTPIEHDAARINLNKTNLTRTHFEGANLIRGFLRQAYLVETHFEEANLSGSHMEDAYLVEAHFEDADLTWTHFEQSMLSGVHLERASF